MKTATLARSAPAAVLFMVVAVLLHPGINTVFYPLSKSFLSMGIDKELPLLLSLGLAIGVDLVEYAIVALLAALPATILMLLLGENSLRVSGLIIGVVVGTVLVVTRLWLLYVPPTINAVVGVLILAALAAISCILAAKFNLWVYKRLTTGWRRTE